MFLLKDFVKMYLHPEQIIAISCTEADEADNEVKYTGQCDKLPEEYGNIPVEYIKSMVIRAIQTLFALNVLILKTLGGIKLFL